MSEEKESLYKKEQHKIIAATKNKGKLKEITELLQGLPCEVVSMEEIGILDDIEENGSTFEENALIKAIHLWKQTGETVIADDSGLEVDALGGAPGIYSARYAGEGASDADRNQKLLKALEKVPQNKRTARFVCAVSTVFEDGSSITVRGTCEGAIAFEPSGNNGFGYDPLFFVPEHSMTVAEMDAELKNSISHRGGALKKLSVELARLCERD